MTTNPEDYDRDPAAVRQRAVDMLADINGETNTTSDKGKGLGAGLEAVPL